MQNEKCEDPCADFGSTQRNAIIWFVAIIIIGSALTIKLACVDYWMYENNGETIDYKAYKENRLAHTTIASESIDKRTQADIVSIRNKNK